MKSLLFLLLLVTLFKEIVFSLVIPLWHGPDEQAHFAQVQYLAEFGRPIPNDNTVKDLSQEIFISEELLGVTRNEFGKNKFTHRPGYRTEYTPTIIGKYEALINNQPITARTSFVKFEATRYPPLFYYLSALPYRLGYSGGLIDRVFLARFASILMGIALVFVSFQLAHLMFPRRPLVSLTIATMVSFQPMFSFLTASVNSDNLMNLLFTFILYLCIYLLVKRRLTWWWLTGLITTLIAGLFTKPHFVIVFPILMLLPIFLFPSLSAYLERCPRRFSLIVLAITTLAGLRLRGQIISVIRGETLSFAEVSLRFLSQPQANISLIDHLIWTLRHTVAEVIPWYWGVFNWLGVTLPRIVNRVINRFLILGVAGLIIWVIKHRHLRRWGSTELALLFLGVSSLIFWVILMLWDWLFVRGQGFSFGMQGRYYFPTLTAHMLLLLVGLTSLIPRSWWTKLIGVSFIILNFIGLHTLAKAYYQLWPLTVFFNQISQYKPIYFKFPWLLIWFTLYLVTLIVFLIKYLTFYDLHHSRSRA